MQIVIAFMITFAMASSHANKEEEIYFSEVRQIVNFMNSCDSAGWVKSEPLRKRLATTEKYYELRRKR